MTKRVHQVSALVLLLGCGGGLAPPPVPAGPPVLEQQPSGTNVLLQAVSVVDSVTVWISGHEGTYVRTSDGGQTWHVDRVPAADTLQFRDVHAHDGRTAWLLAAGPGDMSRIYRTDDGGRSWSRQWVNPEPDGFYDCLDFWDDRRGIVYGDAVEGELRVLLTDDGGRHWRRLDAGRLPAALPNEGGFAASGTCVQVGEGGRAWVATGNAPQARVLVTDDYGDSWRVADAPVERGEAAGLTSISLVDARTATAFGGDLGITDRRTADVARTEDGGMTWRALPPVSFAGAVYGGVHVPGTGGRTLVAVGPGGAAVSKDAGASWSTVDERSWWAVGSGGPNATWLAGPEGRVARLRLLP